MTFLFRMFTGRGSTNDFNFISALYKPFTYLTYMGFHTTNIRIIPVTNLYNLIHASGMHS